MGPDYALVPRARQDAFIAALREVQDEFFPEGALDSTSPSRIISQVHYDRLQDLMARTEGSLAFGGRSDARRLRIEPAAYKDVTDGDVLLDTCVYRNIRLIPWPWH